MHPSSANRKSHLIFRIKEKLCPAELAVFIGVGGNAYSRFGEIRSHNIFVMGFGGFPRFADRLCVGIAPAYIFARNTLCDARIGQYASPPVDSSVPLGRTVLGCQVCYR